MLDFHGRTAVVTGAGRGVGRSHALLLASRGASVVVNDLGTSMDGNGSHRGPAGAVVEEIRAAGGTAVADTSSVSTAEGAARIVSAAVENFGGLDIVINNAGILPPHTFPESGVEDLELNFSVHVAGSFQVTRAAWPYLRRSTAARVILTTSSGLFGDPELVAYGSAKAGVLGLGRSLATVGAQEGIQVNLLAPSASTRMSGPDPVFDVLAPEHVSAVAAYLAHESCSLNGEVLLCGGGRVARLLLAETAGFGKAGITPEDVAANIEHICSVDTHYEPKDMMGYIDHLMVRISEIPTH